MDYIIEIKGLKKRYKRKINKNNGIIDIFRKNKYQVFESVRGIALQVKRGEILGFIGLNGAGKSTTIKLLTGIIHPDEGTVNMFGLDTFKNRKKISSKIGVMFGQRSNLIWDLPFVNSLQLLKDIYNVPEKQYEESIKLADEYLDINELMNVPVRTMSLGQRMKCEFTAITLHQPEVYILDEPTIGLDIIIKNQINKFLKYLNEEKNCTIFLTTHDIGDVEKICQRVVVINDGSILIDDHIDKILTNVKDTFASVTFAGEDIPENFEKLNGIDILEKNKNIARIRIDCSINSTKEIARDMITEFEIISINVEKPDLERIILNLYNLTKASQEETS